MDYKQRGGMRKMGLQNAALDLENTALNLEKPCTVFDTGKLICLDSHIVDYSEFYGLKEGAVFVSPKQKKNGFWLRQFGYDGPLPDLEISKIPYGDIRKTHPCYSACAYYGTCFRSNSGILVPVPDMIPDNGETIIGVSFPFVVSRLTGIRYGNAVFQTSKGREIMYVGR